MTLRRRLAALLGLLIAVFTASTLAGTAADGSGSWNLTTRVPRDAGWVPAAQAGQLRLYLRNTGTDVNASIDPAVDPTGESLESLAAGGAIVAWTSPRSGAGAEVVGVARSDAVAVTVVQDDGSAATLALDPLNGFSYTAEAPVAEIEALDSFGTVIGVISVPPTSSICGTSLCRALTASTVASTSSSALWGIYSTPRAFRYVVKPSPTSRSGGAPAKTRPAPRVVVTYGGHSTLSRLNPKTLKPFGKRLGLPTNFATEALSPNGTHLLGASYPHQLAIVDLNALSFDGAVDRRLAADLGPLSVSAASWPAPDRLMVVAQTYKGPYRRNVASRTLIAIDSRTGKAVWRHAITNKATLLAARTVGGRLVLLLAPSGAHPKTQMVIVASPDGSITSSTVRTPYPKDNVNTGVLVVTGGADPAAYLVADQTIFSIDLDTGRLTPHQLTPPPGAPRTAPTVSGSYEAAALGQRLVVSGQVFPLAHGIARTGLYLINPKTWKARLLNRTENDFVISGTRLIAYTRAPFQEILANKPVPGTRHGSGLTIYNQNGTRLHHLYGQRFFLNITGTPMLNYALAFAPHRNWPALLPTTTTRGRARITLPVLLETGQQLLFNPITGASLGHATTLFGNGPSLIYRGETFAGRY